MRWSHHIDLFLDFIQVTQHALTVRSWNGVSSISTREIMKFVVYVALFAQIS